MDVSFSDEELATTGRQTGSSTMKHGVVLPLFQQVLFLLLSLITAGNFPLKVFALLPPRLRRKVFLLLPILNLHRLERQCPVATQGITMKKVWEEIFNERLCQQTKWLTKPKNLMLRINGERCYVEEVGYYLHRLRAVDILRVVLAVPFVKDFTRISMRVKGFKRIKGKVCTLWGCQDCKCYKFYCSSKRIHHFHKIDTNYEEEKFTSAALEAVTILLEHSPLEIGFLSIDDLSGVPSIDFSKAKFQHLLSRIHTLNMQFTRPYHVGVSHHSFIEVLLNKLVSNPDSALRNLNLDIISFAKSSKYSQMLIDVIVMFFSPMSKRNVVPFLKLKTLRIATKLSSSSAGGNLVLRKVLDVIIHQEELEVLELSGTGTCPSHAHDALFQAAGKCFLKPTFQCLTLECFHVTTSAVLDIQHQFLVSFACREQKLILNKVKIYSSGDRKIMSYSSENAACVKSLSVLRCSVTDVGLFSTADVASGILSHPGIKYVDMSGSLDHMDLHKLTASLEKGIGTLKLLNLSGTNLSTIIVRVGPLLDAIFHLPHLYELELVLKDCQLQAKDLDQLYRKWEQESCGRKLRNRSCGESLRKLCVCGNSLPRYMGNLELMTLSLCHQDCKH